MDSLLKNRLYSALSERCRVCNFKAIYHKIVNVSGTTIDLEKHDIRLDSKYFDSTVGCKKFVGTNLEYLEYKYEKSLKD